MSDAYLAEWIRKLDQLSPYSVIFRYPVEDATVEEAKAAVKAMKTVRRFLQGALETTIHKSE